MSSNQNDHAENELGEIRPCDCNGVYLTMGPMTLHLSKEELAWLSQLATAGLNFESPPTTRKGGKGRAHGPVH